MPSVGQQAQRAVPSVGQQAQRAVPAVWQQAVYMHEGKGRAALLQPEVRSLQINAAQA